LVSPSGTVIINVIDQLQADRGTVDNVGCWA
jgi:hypothetical protein